ncbi:hypothetical protein HNP48_005872 [Acidovorax soli]|uniref:DUF5329 domain-containing protein n=1 Tax=Acidovorax soli TaxID=592050 RepID=A0A7X0PJN9_9BURK|nr:DUF5329 family protein [Acidovorax soli]MBB6563153.1 hypothetical protein [Acidovorax soli]
MTRRHLQHTVVAWGLSLVAGLAFAAPAAAPVRGEIDRLLAALQSSGCEFQRNGSWHGAAEAKTHLLRKLDYIEKRSTLPSTEKFIELAASSSSASGQAYQVRCNGSVQPSAQWFAKELQKIRAGGSAGGPGMASSQ